MGVNLKFNEKYVGWADGELKAAMEQHNSSVDGMRESQRALQVDVDACIEMGVRGLVAEMLDELRRVPENRVKAMLLEREMLQSYSSLWAELQDQTAAQLQELEAEWAVAFDRQVEEMERIGVCLKWLVGPEGRRLAVPSRIQVELSLKEKKDQISIARDAWQTCCRLATDTVLAEQHLDYEIRKLVKGIAGVDVAVDSRGLSKAG